MKKLIQQLLGESAIYGISGMLSRFITIFLVPLYTKLLSPAEYGKLGLVNSTNYFVVVLAMFAMDSASARFYYDNDEEKSRKSVMASWFWFQLAFSVVLCLLLFLLSGVLSNSLLKNKSDYILFLIPALGLLTSILPNMVTNWLRYQRKAVHTVIFSIALVLLNILLNILFVLYFKWNVFGILLATVLANAIASLYVLWLMRSWISFKFVSKSKLKEMLHFAYPLVPTAFAFWILNSSSAFVINYYHNQTAVGLFQIGNMIASAVAMITGAFQMAWGPFAFSIVEKPEAKRMYSLALSGYSIIMCSAALVVALFAKEILMLFTQQAYYDAQYVAGVLCFNGIIYGYAYIAVLGCSIKKDNKPLAYAVFMAAILTATLYWLLVPNFGIIGAAVSTALGYLIVPIYLFYKSQQYYPIPFKFWFSILVFLLSVGIFIFSSYVKLPGSTLQQIMFKVSGMLVYLALLAGIFFLFHQHEIKKYRANR